MTKKKLKKEFPRVTLASITKEMAQPRFAESARKEEEANHHVTWWYAWRCLRDVEKGQI
ncbi:MAG: hypothetical protein ACLP3K_03640 [Candidatus Acidiferrales bacterium]